MSLTGDKCETGCEDSEIQSGKQCVCNSDNILHNSRKYCILKEQCARKRADGDGFICLSDNICTGKLKLSLDGKRLCVEDCPSWVVDEITNEQKCVAKCPEVKYRTRTSSARNVKIFTRTPVIWTVTNVSSTARTRARW